MVNDIQKVEFDLEALHRAFPDAAKSALDQRVTVRSPGPGALLDIAFGGESHSKQQQALQEWLFGRCARLPISGGDKGLRQECTKRVATFAAVLQRDGFAPSSLREEAAVALGLNRKATYMASGSANTAMEATQDVSQASAAAKADPELTALLKAPDIAAALERIAADPSAIRQYAGNARVQEALQKLNSLLKG